MNRPLPPHTNPTPSYASHASQNDYQSTAAAALSQQHTPTSNNIIANAANGRKRKASGAAGSRGVANLTPEQLAKKRANDREAQRAIRERTRNTIETLERRIRELESQQPFQELQRVLQERDRALQQVDDLRRKLDQVASVVGGSGAQAQLPNLHELATLTAQQSPLPPLSTSQQHPQHPQLAYAHPGAGQQPPCEPQQQHLHPDLRSPRSSGTHSHSSSVAHTTPGGANYQADGTALLRKWSPALEHSLPPSQYTAAHGPPYEHQRPQPPSQMQPQSNGERLGLNFLLDNTHMSTNTPPAPEPLPPYRPPPAPEPPVWSRLPHNTPPSCPLDALLLDFLANRKQQLASGIPMSEVVGPEYPSLAALIDPQPHHLTSCHPVSALLIDILSKFPDLDALPEKVAVLYIMFLIMRWMICPCQRCYERLPEWVRPLPEQVEKAHPAWFDHLPWPIMRRALIFRPERDHVNFEEWFVPFTSNQSVNWPYPKDQVLITDPSPSTPGEAKAIKMNPVFESHLRDLSHWSIGTTFKATFPEMVDGNVKVIDRKS